MIKYKAKTKDCLLTVKVKLPLGSSLNERELDFFSRKLLRGFFKPQVLKKNLIVYTGFPYMNVCKNRLVNMISSLSLNKSLMRR